MISLQGNQDTASHEAAKKQNWGKQAQTVNSYYTLVVEAQRLVVYTDVCACIDLYFFILTFLTIETKKGIGRKEPNKKLETHGEDL